MLEDHFLKSHSQKEVTDPFYASEILEAWPNRSFRFCGHHTAWLSEALVVKDLSMHRVAVAKIDLTEDSRVIPELTNLVAGPSMMHFTLHLNLYSPNSMVFAQCIAQVLRKQSGIKTKEDHDSALADSYFETTSRHLSYIFRHTNLMHRDGSLSLHELISHPGTARKIRTLFREGKKSLQHFDENEIIYAP